VKISPLFSLRIQREKVEQHLTIWDFVLTPLYLAILIFIARRIREKNYPKGHPLRPYYLPGLLVKFGGAIFIALVYQYYYNGGGDTFNFYQNSLLINSALDDSISLWVKLLFRVSPETDPYIYKYSSQLLWYDDPNTYIVGVFGAVFGLLNGTTYIPIALLFAFFTFTGIWAMFKTFVSIYPGLTKHLALAFLFVPSTVVWGSAMFKDTICMFGLGWLTYAVFRIFLQKDLSVKNLLFLGLSFYLVAIVKVYILLAFSPALGIWLLMTYSSKIRHASIRWLISIAFVGICIASFFLVSQRYENELGRYSLDNLAYTAKVTQGYISDVSEDEGGSAYDLGSFDATFGSMIIKFPQAVVVTLFRPFLWEIKKPIMLLSALESLLFLGLFVLTLYKRGVTKSFRRVISDPNLIFFIVYSLIFAFAVGISTGNFGSLSRYKIPCMPFFAAFLLILYYKQNEIKLFIKKQTVAKPSTGPYVKA
jgi:hypothetical protein